LIETGANLFVSGQEERDANLTELIGWVSATVMPATIGRQVYSQWRDCSSQGISRRLFIRQFMASVGFVIYSWLAEKLCSSPPMC
jgi:uncharacterized protein with PQ loop repeat